MNELSGELLASLITPSVVVGIVGYLLKRSIHALDVSLVALQGEVKAVNAALGQRDVNIARLEAKVEALEREVFSKS